MSRGLGDLSMTKQSKAKQSKTKQNQTKQNKLPCFIDRFLRVLWNVGRESYLLDFGVKVPFLDFTTKLDKMRRWKEECPRDLPSPPPAPPLESIGLAQGYPSLLQSCSFCY
jgi:hypothetical protein